jgi:Leucine-rich repeat (LRR) protein
MDDREIIDCLSSVCRFSYIMEGDSCTSISFFDEKDIFGGTIRHHPLKRKILDFTSTLSHLKYLNLRKCKVGYIPHMSTNSLEWLDLSSNDLPTAPTWILSQLNLAYLSLGANMISEVSDLSGLKFLRTVKLHKNRLTHIPGMCNDIVSLNLFLNPLNEISSCISHLHNLEVFVYGMTKAKQLPSFSDLQKLRFLIMPSCEIEELPEEICSLSQLNTLVLAKNKIKHLPDQIGKLSNLKSLSLYYNNIRDLPGSFFDLKLNRLNLQKNKLSNKENLISNFSKIDFFKV